MRYIKEIKLKTKVGTKTYLLFIADDPRTIFLYFNKSDFNGLNFVACEKRLKEGGTYIDGWANESPTKDKKPYLFLNLKSLNELPLVKVATLIYHEATHLAIMFYGQLTDETEEDIISLAEKITIDIIDLLNYPKIYFKLELCDVNNF
jgi:hypothetical protein